MDAIRRKAETSTPSTRTDAVMEDRYRRLHYEPAVVGARHFWGQPPPKGVPLPSTRFKKHPPISTRKKGKEATKPEHFEGPVFRRQYKEKYGSVSAHSTSAIYGALRAPHCHAMYRHSDGWYSSVRSLNSRPRETVYTAEAYDWRETIYEERSREGCIIPPPPMEYARRPVCVCMMRRIPHPPDVAGHGKPPMQQPRCKYCALPTKGPPNGVPSSSNRTPPKCDKMRPAVVPENPVETPKHTESTSRMSSYKKGVPGSGKFASVFAKGKSTKDPGVISRKSILECDVTAYDLIKKEAKTPSASELDDSDVDDNLNDNAVAKSNKYRRYKSNSQTKQTAASNGSPCHNGSKKLSAKFRKAQSENCIYSESPSVLVGGQRIFTDNHRSKSPNLMISSDLPNEGAPENGDHCSGNWQKFSPPDEVICIPDPDYDYSDDSEDGTVIVSRYRDAKFTYSPPSVRKSYDETINGLGSSSREISKSMSSLLSDDTIISSVNAINSPITARPKNYRGENHGSPKTAGNSFGSPKSNSGHPQSNGHVAIQEAMANQDSKYESSSDCSSSCGTLSSDYPTWTSSSSNELKSILKKKKQRKDVSIQELEDASRVFRSAELREAQRKKQVQFHELSDRIARDAIDFEDDDIDLDASSDKDSRNDQDFDDDDVSLENRHAVITCDIYETLNERKLDTSSISSKNEGNETDDLVCANEDDYEAIGDIGFADESTPCGDEEHPNAQDEELPHRVDSRASSIKYSIADDSNAILSPELLLPPKLPPVLSTSLEDVRGRGTPKADKCPLAISEGAKDKGQRRRRRTTLPKRRFSDLHLHMLLCPTRSSLCGDGSSSDDVPLTSAPQRAHRSLPDSPSELDEVRSFCFDFLEKGSKEKVPSLSRSVFYVSVENNNQESSAKTPKVDEPIKCDRPVSPSTGDGVNCQSDNSDANGHVSPPTYDTDDDNAENEYENLDPIYEELSDVSSSSKRLTSLELSQKSFFEGASKIDILSYLEDAKERGISEGLSEDEKIIIEEEDEDEKVLSGEEEDGGEKEIVPSNGLSEVEVELKIEKDVDKTEEIIPEDTDTASELSKQNARISEVERNDSGVGAETSKPARTKLLPVGSVEQLCADCDHQVEPVSDGDTGGLLCPLVCRKCELRRSERKEIIIEFVDTELKYGRDLRIIKEEFYRPMEIAGLLVKEQLTSIFLNLDELIAANVTFSERLQDALDIAMEHGDEDYTTVNIGKIFLETSSMLHAFETYCVRQAPASVILNHLEKEKELLRIFLRVSQMENTLLRRMNLPAFLMVPVQRVTRYPLLLSRLHKVTPIHHKDRTALKEAQQKVELHLEHINLQTKGVGGTKIWRRISNISASHRRLGKDIGNIKVRKMALEILQWKQDEVHFVMAGKLLFAQIADYPWNKKGKTVKFAPVHALLVALGKPNSNYRPEASAIENPILFPRNTGIRDASLILMKEKNDRFSVIRDPLYLGNCVICCESEIEDTFEIQEYTTKEAYLLKGENITETKEWLQQLRYHAKDLGSWRKRRNALANIMINGMIRQ